MKYNHRLSIFRSCSFVSKYRVVGSATIETVISMVVFVPLILSVPVLGKYMDIKQKAMESSRYAAWERTVWSDNGIGWGNAAAVSKPDDLIEAEVDSRFFGHPLQPIDSLVQEQTENPLWGTRRNGQDIRFLGTLADQDDDDIEQGLRAEVELSEYDPGHAPPTGLIVDAVADKGVANLVGPLASLNNVSVAGCELGVNLERGMMLGSENRADLTLRTPINNVLGDRNLLLEMTAGILSNAWVVPKDSEDLYRLRVGEITAAQPVNCVTVPAVQTFGHLAFGTDRALFGEVRRAAPVEDTLNPFALPEERRIDN